ncbi:hypothetical protein Ancab_038929 [Ancistrocladus abbreviatus]
MSFVCGFSGAPLVAQVKDCSLHLSKQVKDAAHQDDVVRVLTTTLHHLLRPPSFMVHHCSCLCSSAFWACTLQPRVLELNARDDPGINLVHTK